MIGDPEKHLGEWFQLTDSVNGIASVVLHSDSREYMCAQLGLY